MADKALGMLVDYDYCTGCHSCEVSCKERFDMAEDEWGIKLADNGPWRYSETDWEWNHVPIPTEECDLCADRLAAGRRPCASSTARRSSSRWGRSTSWPRR